MKKTIFALLALEVFGVANAAYAAYTGNPVIDVEQVIPTQRTGANNPDGSKTHAKITVIGEVVANTCEIKSDDRSQTVTLKKVGTNQLVKSGDVAADKLVQIRLINCNKNGMPNAAGTTDKVTVQFNATDKIDYHNNGTLRNLEKTGKAENVNIQFANLDGTSIRLGQEDSKNTLKPVTAANGANHVVQFVARYYATGQSTAGKVKGEAELDLAYE
ncbi:TPA: fimbrial protein [Haemophilus influenzae]